MSWAPERAVVINLPRRPDRLAAFQSRAGRLGFACDLVPAVDGQVVQPPERWRGSAGAWGNAQSHLRALEGDGASVAVFEDDAVIPAGFAHTLTGFLARVPADWECVVLGGAHPIRPEPVTAGVLRVRRFERTHAYLLRGDAISVARDCADRAIRHWDLSFGRVMGYRGRTYATEPWLVPVEADLGSDIADSEPLVMDRTGYVH